MDWYRDPNTGTLYNGTEEEVYKWSEEHEGGAMPCAVIIPEGNGYNYYKPNSDYPDGFVSVDDIKVEFPPEEIVLKGSEPQSACIPGWILCRLWGKFLWKGIL